LLPLLFLFRFLGDIGAAIYSIGNKLSVPKVNLIGFGSWSSDKFVLYNLDYDLAFSLRDDFVPKLHDMCNTFPRGRLCHQLPYIVDLLL
jgi:hypothetical protein